MRVALDTNTVVSGLLWGGPPAEIFDRVTDETIDAVTSEALLAELARVLTRPKFAAKLATKQRTGAEIVTLYTQLAKRYEPVPLPPVPGLRDPDDYHVLACAVAADADLIVSGDRDLLELKEYQAIPIVNSAEAVARIARSARSA